MLRTGRPLESLAMYRSSGFAELCVLAASESTRGPYLHFPSVGTHTIRGELATWGLLIVRAVIV